MDSNIIKNEEQTLMAELVFLVYLLWIGFPKRSSFIS